jgi:hypothetical protein
MRTHLLLFVLVALSGGCASGGSAAGPGRAAALWPDAPLFAPESRSLLESASAWSARLAEDDEDEQDSTGLVGIGWTILWYVPNRILDAFDMVRARIRLGPGFAVGARATKLAEAYVGFYATVYVGLPGPRGRKFPRLPVGLESRTGAAASVVDATVEGGIGPDYGFTEIGAGFQLALIGVDVGVDPMEILDFIVGFATFDPQEDDY